MNQLKKLFDGILQFLRDLVYGPDERPSLLATMTLGLFLLFVFVTLWILFTEQDWPYYAVFATTTTTLATGGKVVDKYINNKF